MDTTSSDAQEHLRRVIDDEIKALEQSIRARKYRRNALAPISRLPPETLAMIFSFMSSSTGHKKTRYLAWLHATHVCRHWRETALNYPRLWSHIDFNKLAPATIAEMLARAKLAPLHLEAKPTFWSKEEFDFFESQVEAHRSHVRHLSLTGFVLTRLERLVSPAPALEYLTLGNISCTSDRPDHIAIHDTPLNFTAPKLASVKMVSCDISWKSPLLKGLQSLEILRPLGNGTPTLEDWLDALNEMVQLKTLVLTYASPMSTLGDPRLSQPRRTVTLPSLTQFDIVSSATDCALALSHLMLPALTSLSVHTHSRHLEDRDVGLLIPHVARNAHGPQDSAPLQSIVIRGGAGSVEILAWTSPDADVEACNPITILRSERVVFTADLWRGRNTDTRILDALLRQLPMDAISNLSMEGHAQLRKEFWLSHASSLAMLKRARLTRGALKAFRETLAEDSLPNGPRFPKLTKLILVKVPLTALRTYHLHDVLIKRVEQGAPLEALDLRTCFATERATQLLAETVGDVQRPAKPLKTSDPRFFNWKGGVDFFNEEEKRADDYPWYDCTDEEDEEDWDDYDEDSDPYSDEL